eukprot:2541204-Rhodomonas_salina.1
MQAEGVRFVNPGCRQPARRPTVARRSLSLMGKTMDAEEDAVHGASGNRDRPQRYAVKRVEATGIVRPRPETVGLENFPNRRRGGACQPGPE